MKNFDLLTILLKWKITLVIVSALAVVLSSVFSSPFFIKPKYKSTAVIYPSNLMPYSQESTTEQMLQLFQSDSIFNHLADYFHLIRHYELDSASPTIHHELLVTYNENVSIKKTEYEAVKIEVMDQKPEVACSMINEMVNAFNAYTLKLNREKSRELVPIFGNLMKTKQEQIDSITTALKELAVKFGIIDYKAQSRELSKEYYRTIATGNEKKINELTNSLRNLEERGGKFHELQQHLNQSTKEYGKLLIQYNTVVSDAEKHLTYTNMVVKPFPSDKRAYPVRWLIVTIATFASVLFSLIVIMLIEQRKTNNN
ncbi:MAG: Wzz/FepE/Etk N-terminal domain-containing protein [Bacteroidota bacterium]